jgi:hypothetical protein
MKWINIECIVYEIGEILAEGGVLSGSLGKDNKAKELRWS